MKYKSLTAKIKPNINAKNQNVDAVLVEGTGSRSKNLMADNMDTLS